MLVGIIADSHDDMEALARAVDLFNRRGAAAVVHAGDFVSPFTFEMLRNLEGEFTGIFGNNDGDRLLLRERSGGTIHNQPLITDLGGKKAVVVHEPAVIEALADSGDFDLVIYGHMHEAAVRRRGKTMVVNPGKAARLHRGAATVALLDTEVMEVEICSLFEEEGETSGIKSKNLPG